MSITIVTRYSGDAEAIVKAAKANGPLLLKYGATEARLFRIATGEHFGQHVTIVSYDSYAAYGASNEKLLKDAAYNKALVALRKAAVAEDRTIHAAVPY